MHVYHRKKVMSFAHSVIKILESQEKPDKGMNILEITAHSGASEGYVRNQLRYMEQTGLIERVDNRTPIYFRVSPNSPIRKHEQRIAEYKQRLITGDAKGNAVLTLVLSNPKKEWLDAIPAFEATAQAIKELEAEGKLVDT